MLFNSIHFIAFLLCTLFLFTILPKHFRRHLLLAASLYFYASWSIKYLLLVILVISVSYTAGILCERKAKSFAPYYIIAIATPLLVLAVFKYGDFFIDNINTIFYAFDSQTSFDSLSFILPIGISFYTFQAISYVIDVQRGRLPAERNILDYSLYITFFPQLVAGPIERASNILPQIKNSLDPATQNITPAFTLILTGFFKKLVVADRLGMLVDTVYSNPSSATPEEAILAAYFFAFQIYCDFSGYTDIARGTAKLFNIDLMENFNRPYFSTSIRDFWRRWHISLSTWFRDYLYIPLGGSRRSSTATARNILIVFILCGLWHGAAYTFILWGFLHGIILVAQHVYDRHIHMPALPIPDTVKKYLCIFITFHIVTVFWVFFRAKTIGDGLVILSSAMRISDPSLLATLVFSHYEHLLGLIFIVLLLIFEIASTRMPSDRSGRFRIAVSAYHMLCFYCILAFGIFDVKSFIYFQF